MDTKEKIISLGALAPVDYDEIEMDYTGGPGDSPTTVTYKRRGVTVCVLTLTYSGSNLTNISSSIDG